ncbi:MAG TPA: DUF502 domain-containing protein [Chthoniobacteraceae bacterium]|jgi:uncharacterized membrane protein|nr:DUF502 domain-containing protein [Chthoniobacteraceae bacterium]
MSLDPSKPKRTPAPTWRGVLVVLRNKLFAGIVAAIPLIVTFYVLKIAYGFINDISEPVLDRIFGKPTPGLGFAVTVVMLMILGFVSTNVLGQRMLLGFEKLVLRVPLVATIYAGVKQFIDSVKAFNGGNQFKRVAYVEYPSPGCKLIGFVTGHYFDERLQLEMTSVVIPTAPNPMTGLVIVVESSRVIDSALTIEEATKLIVSAGLVVPRKKGAPQEPTPVAAWPIPDSVALAVSSSRELEK